ncbi:hypothetical protein D9M73_141940 [compost metagenome]
MVTNADEGLVVGTDASLAGVYLHQAQWIDWRRNTGKAARTQELLGQLGGRPYGCLAVTVENLLSDLR